MSAVIVSEVVKAFSPAFNSVDLRIVAVKPEDRWINVIASILLSAKSREEINSEQEEARDKLPKTDKFRIFLDNSDIKQLRMHACMHFIPPQTNSIKSYIWKVRV